MSSQKQWKRTRNFERFDRFCDLNALVDEQRARITWLQRRPPWWKFWAVRKWKGGGAEVRVIITIWAIVSTTAILTGLYLLWRRKHPRPCNSCKHLQRKGGASPYRYECSCDGGFSRPPEYCARYAPREEAPHEH